MSANSLFKLKTETVFVAFNEGRPFSSSKTAFTLCVVPHMLG